jgi:hypothetical protein
VEKIYYQWDKITNQMIFKEKKLVDKIYSRYKRNLLANRVDNKKIYFNKSATKKKFKMIREKIKQIKKV